MLFNIAICDDDSKENNLILSYIKQFEMEFNIDFNISTFTSGNELLETYDSPGTYNILFLDVEMPAINGIEVASKIRELNDRNVKIIFISNYPQYMQDSFEVQAYNYLPKPLKYESFRKIILKIAKDYEASHISKLVVHQDNTTEFVNANDIVYIQSIKDNDHHVEFCFRNKTVIGKGNFGTWEKDLAKHNFISPYRGILININHIHYISNSTITLINGISVPLSRRKEKEIRALFSTNILSTIIYD